MFTIASELQYYISPTQLLLSLSFNDSLRVDASLAAALQVKPILIEFDKGDTRPSTHSVATTPPHQR